MLVEAPMGVMLPPRLAPMSNPNRKMGGLIPENLI